MAARKLRLKEAGVQEVVERHDLEYVMGTKRTAESVAAGLTDEEVQELLDEAIAADVLRKQSEAKLKALKPVLMEYAQRHEVKTLASSNGHMSISPSTSTGLDPMVVLAKLREIGKKHLFPTVFSVLVGKAKDYLGKDVIEEIATVETREYGSISFKPKK